MEKTYKTKGIFTQDEKDPCIKYSLIAGNVAWAIIFFGTAVAPVYFFGFSLWEPARVKSECEKK